MTNASLYRRRRPTFIFALACVAILALPLPTTAQEHEFVRAQTFEQAHDAVCRVTVSGARGTAFFFGVYNGKAYFGTNCHVVESNKTARLDFWNNGPVQSVTAQIEWRANDGNLPADFSYMLVDPDALREINPPWIALGGEDARPSVGAVIISCGAPDGRFTQAWKGQVLEYYNGKTAIFSPPPVPGQSGSPICEYVDGELFVTGILTWLIGEKGRDDSKGGAIPISNLYKALKRRGVNVDYHDQSASPIPPGATECADTTAQFPCVLFFTQKDCPPCKDAERDVEELRALNIPVYVYDVATERGSEYCARYKVTRTPTFVVLNKKYFPSEPISGAGKVAEIKSAFDAVNVEEETPTVDDVYIDEPAQETIPINLPATDPKPEEDFRNRPAFYEQPFDVGIFEESNRRWLNRGKRGGDDAEDAPEETPEENKRPRLGERLTDGAVDAIADKVESKINEKAQAIKNDLREKWNAVKRRVVFGFCFLVAIGVIFAELIVSAARYCWRKARQIKAAYDAVAKKEESAK